ncbi:MAG: hypothetical protein Q8R16_02230 [bacterium]|nr:hypothetical protein [bacterium]
MVIIKGTDGRREWIAGVFAEREAADRYLAGIPDDQRAQQYILVEEPGLTFPVRVMERPEQAGVPLGPGVPRLLEIITDMSQFGMLCMRIARLHGRGGVGDLGDFEERTYAIVFRFDRDWTPPGPHAGVDRMGHAHDILHVDGRHIQAICDRATSHIERMPVLPDASTTGSSP